MNQKQDRGEEQQGSEQIDPTEHLRQTLGCIVEIFEFWRIRMGHPRACLDQKRRSKIRQRLCDGYKKQDIIDAIEGCALSSFHMGTDPKNQSSTVFDDIELICRDAKHVDMFIKVFERERAKKAQLASRLRYQADEEDRRRRERDERAGKSRVGGLRSIK